MTEIIFYIVVFITGGITALLYLWILNLSIKKILQEKVFSSFAIIGFFLRLFICGLSFFLCSWGGRFDRLAVCFGGFLLVRILALKFIKSSPVPSNPGKEEKNEYKS
jgi:hypothetical protein